MSGPITQNLETENYVRPSSPIAFEQHGTDNAGYLSNTWNINAPLPYIVLAIALSVFSLATAFMAVREAQLMERETRIMQDDLKYIRAYLSARGINIPASHEEAEEK